MCLLLVYLQYYLFHNLQQLCSPSFLTSNISANRLNVCFSVVTTLGFCISESSIDHCAKKPVTTMLTYQWKCTVLHYNHLRNTWKPLVLMTRHFDYCPSASEGDNQSVRSSAPVVSRCFPGGYNVKLYISRGRLAWWLLAFLCCDHQTTFPVVVVHGSSMHRLLFLQGR